MAGEIKYVKSGSLKKGNYIMIDEIACAVHDVQTSRPGKHGHAKHRITGIGLIDGKKRVTVTADHEVAAPVIEKRNAQVLSVSGNTANVMDVETYETFDVDVPEELQGQLYEGATALYWVVQDSRVLKQIKQ